MKHRNAYYDTDHVNRFVSFLYRQEDTANPVAKRNLAELRRSATDPLNDYRSVWILGDYLPDTNGWPFDAYRLVAVLFAIHKQRSPGNKLSRFQDGVRKRSLGASLRKLRSQLSVGQESLDQRFAALLNTEREDLAVPLRGLIQRIAALDRPIPVDYHCLIKDLLFWGSPNKPSQRAWARNYWQPVAMSADEDPNTHADQSTDEVAPVL